MPVARRLSSLAVLTWAIAGVVAAPAFAQGGPGRDEPVDQIVISGRVDVPRGGVVGEVVMLHGRVTIAGVARGDVVVLDGRIVVLGQVSGSVVNIGGSVLLGANAQVGGDVLAREGVAVREGAVVDGDIREGAAFTFRTPIDAFGRFAGWLAVSVSTLILGFLLILLAPRGADAVYRAARTRPWSSLGWGVAVSLLLPIGALLAIASLLGLPFGLGLLLALAFVYFVGYAASAWVLGRLVMRPSGSPAVAFLVGWAILRAVALIPFAGLATWIPGAIFGLGAVTVATLRSRGVSGKHRGKGIERRRAAPEEVVVVDAPAAQPTAEAPAARSPASEPPEGGVL